MTAFANRRFLLSASLAALGFSLLGKVLTDSFLTKPLPLLGTLVGLVPAHNPGISFGLTFPPLIQTALIGGALLLVLWAAFHERHSTLVQWGFGLIIGGALGNLIDRLKDGLVTDMFQVASFPVFNVADSCITIGAIVLLWSGFRRSLQ